ncbi:MAG: hypothetical protein JW938_02125 [Candidatus Omnitrophica bacterium]|nr:hypothetical protein [Candidatus Omnitrophota bacterium]
MIRRNTSYIVMVLNTIIMVLICMSPRSVWAQEPGRDLAISIVTQYADMHENERYLRMKELDREKAELVIDENYQQNLEQIDAEIGIIANSLRTSLFRNKEKIYNLQKLRYELFSTILAQQHECYEHFKCSDAPADIVKCDELFTHMQNLEIKVYGIEADIRRLELGLFKEQAREEAFTLLAELDRLDRGDFAGRVAIKKKLFSIVHEITVRLQYPTDAIARVERELQALDEFSKTYSYWNENEAQSEEDMINMYKTPSGSELPTKPWDSSEMIGRRNYMDTVVKKENDKRKGVKRNPRNIRKSAPQTTLGLNVKEKIMARED